MNSVLELAAGPAEHARELAHRGLRATALDHSAAMCGYAAGQAKAGGVTWTWLKRTCATSASPDGRPVLFDLAITMLNSVCHLFTLDDLVDYLGAVAAHLAPGGVYIVELAHPADFFATEPRGRQRVDDRPADGARTRRSAGVAAMTGSTRSPR